MNLYLATCDDWQRIAAVSGVGHYNFLSSYYHTFYNKNNQFWIDAYKKQCKEHDSNWIMDSGLFTMMFGAGKGKTYTEADLEKYTIDYINKMKSIGYKHNIVECDVHKILGMKQVYKFRKIFEENWPLKKTIFVWHVEEGIDGLEAMVKKYPYIALSIPELKIYAKEQGVKLETMVFNLLYKIRKKSKKVKVHLLGCTQISLIQNGYYDSMDSSSWLYGSTFNRQVIFNQKKMNTVSCRNKEYQKMFNHYKGRFRKALDKYSAEFGRPLYKSDKGLKNSVNIMISADSYMKMERQINRRFYGKNT